MQQPANSPKPAVSASISVPMLDLRRQYQPLHVELLEALGDVLKTQQFILGEPVAAFERAAAGQLGVKHAIGCSSGTDALWLALAAAKIGHGSAVTSLTNRETWCAASLHIALSSSDPLDIELDQVFE